ncbi:MAG: alpha-D-glucose phosphate-specific phosphoglucomutase [Deltaproteobacteria bacterium]|nr:alpha-D-glucose phosphate-specific phosphoglucomutase [Deltaproteobacteria bacterium]
MTAHPLAGRPAPSSMVVNLSALIDAYYTVHPDVGDASQRVAFGTSGHRGSSLSGSFNEDHILAVTQAVCDYRKARGISGPLFIGRDTHALSEPSLTTALEVLAANDVSVMTQKDRGYTPTPVISHAICSHNRHRDSGLADGIVITPSHNPPEDGGFKYNPPEGGPADVHVTQGIERRANDILGAGLREVLRMPCNRAARQGTIRDYDYVDPYVKDLENVLEMAAIRDAQIRIGVDPLGGSTLAFWEPIATRYGLRLDVVNPAVDPTFAFMTLDWDGKIRMDCSSPWAMAGLIDLRNRYDIAFGNDPDGDRHGIVTPAGGLMNPNHYLSVAIWYLFRHRPGWRADAAVGKTLVSSSMIDRVAANLGIRLVEVPVGFKWFVAGLLDGSYGFGGEESAGASFLRKDGTVWATDKDGIIMNLLAAEITARIGKDPFVQYRELAERFGDSIYERIDVPATARQRSVLKELSPEGIAVETLAGDQIQSKLSHAPGNGEAIGGIKVSTQQGWFAARPSGTEDVYKVYAESFRDRNHLERIQREAQRIIDMAFRKAG